MNITGTVTALRSFIETASLLIFHSVSTIVDKKLEFRVNIIIESVYTIKGNARIPEFAVVI